MPRVDEFHANPFAAPESDLQPEFEYQNSGPVEYAGFWARLVATIVDGIMIQCCMIVLATVILVVAGMTSIDQGLATLIVLLIGFICGWLYNALQESSEGRATLGKKLMGLKVVDLAGRKINFARASGRYFAKTFSAIILMIGFLIQPLNDKKQALHDMMAGTLVTKG
ncbi:RDD family protein [Schlesneria paludicola]|uniref:RDD family protein n=1 Tax=Schlesneria paludicola TaxID=360056 RepID=UPI000299D692|nr:RDD family protein [Schlesneria paludicola]